MSCPPPKKNCVAPAECTSACKRIGSWRWMATVCTRCPNALKVCSHCHHLLPNFVPRDRCCHRTFLGLLLTQIHRMLCPFCSSLSKSNGAARYAWTFVSVTSGMDNVGPFLGTMCVGKNACQSGASRRGHPTAHQDALPLLYRTPRGAETDS